MALYVGGANSSNKFQGNLSSDPSSSLAEGDIFYNSTDNVYKWYNGTEWVQFGAAGADGSQLRPFTTMSEMAQAAAPDGAYYVQLSGMSSSIQTYVRKVNNVYYVLAASVTNSDGDTADWWTGDSTKANSSGTNYFTTDTTLRTSSMQNETTKDNAKNEIFNTVSFNKLMIKEDHNGTTGFRAYTLNASKKFKNKSFFVINPDTIWRKKYKKEFRKLEKVFLKHKKPAILLVSKNKSFDRSFKGGFNINSKNQILRQLNNKYIFICNFDAW